MENGWKGKLEEVLCRGSKSGSYELQFSKAAERTMEGMYRKNQDGFYRVAKALLEIYVDPRGEHLSNFLSGYMSKHAGKYVIIFKTIPGTIYIDNIDKHDAAYGFEI